MARRPARPRTDVHIDRAEPADEPIGEESNMANIDGMRIAFVTANEGVEQVELRKPWQELHEAGGRPPSAAPAPRGAVPPPHGPRGAQPAVALVRAMFEAG